MSTMEPLKLDPGAWDGRAVHGFADPETGAHIFVAIHSIRGDRAIGGTRVKVYPGDEEAILDAQRLAGGMTLKWAGVGIEAGGGKAVISLREPISGTRREALLKRYGQTIAALPITFATGPDLGTSSTDMNWIAAGAPGRVFGRTPEAGGGGDPAPYTARGVFESMRVTANHLWPDGLKGRRVLLQGVGHVGARLLGLLRAEGAELAFSDLDPATVRNWEGLGVPAIEPQRVFSEPCDLFAPCAVGGIINEETIPQLACKAVVGAANNQLGEPADADRLRRRGILYAPDFIANCGGAIALLRIELDGWDKQQVMQAIIKTVQDNLGRVYAQADSKGISTDQAARDLAQAAL
ncbi:MAG: Glu/Leu/Phe/Val dehydrogenase dimerization domain-containing protein [Xanthomonadales bacterium]|nr:Glu/Leu/Phe/Val dehydrogenase dimerization domain-containing protein [Xanthomonadales bacterium]